MPTYRMRGRYRSCSLTACCHTECKMEQMATDVAMEEEGVLAGAVAAMAMAAAVAAAAATL